MKIAVGAPVAERAWVLPMWLDCIHNQFQPDEMAGELEVFAIYTPSHDHTYDILIDNGVHVLEVEDDSRPVERIVKHAWSKQEFQLMSWLRNRLVEFVLEWEPDYFFSLDTDILIPPNCIASLYETMCSTGANAVSPLVDMEADRRQHPVAWNFMQWKERKERDGTIKRLPDRIPWQGQEPVPTTPFPIDVLLAAIFMDRKAMWVRWSEAEGGEDIGWAHHADELGVSRWVEPRITAPHLMTPPR